MLIRWAVQRGTSALPKSTRPERIRSNLDVFDWRLDQPDFDRLSQLATQLRMVDGSIWLSPRGPYRKLSELWDEAEEDGRLQRYVEGLYERGVQLPVVELGPGGWLRPGGAWWVAAAWWGLLPLSCTVASCGLGQMCLRAATALPLWCMAPVLCWRHFILLLCGLAWVMGGTWEALACLVPAMVTGWGIRTRLLSGPQQQLACNT